MDNAQPAVHAPVAPPPWPTLAAPPEWRSIDFISDLHLDADEPETFLAWRHYLSHTPADAVFILGDLFEVWVGDDALAADPAGFEARCARTLLKASTRRAVFVMHGNRDFLVGDAFASACGATLLPDPTVLQFAGQQWLLSHGDALCLADTEYLQFRAQVRGDAWQHAFLGQPLPQRRTAARELRARSEERKRGTNPWADVDATEAAAWLRAANARTLIHGHTHRPADHALGDGLQRIVLSDWDLRADPPRAQVLRIDAQAQLQRHGVHRDAALSP
jgi:UDP-2,3-diacylglucosamine hydrolase